MKKIDLTNVVFNAVDGTEIKVGNSDNPILAYEQVANMLLESPRATNPIRQHNLAFDFYKNKGVMEVEDQDFACIEKAIKDSHVSVAIKAPILITLKETPQPDT